MLSDHAPHFLHFRDFNGGVLPNRAPRFLWQVLWLRYRGRVLLLLLATLGGIGLHSFEPLLLRDLIKALQAGGDAVGWRPEVWTPLLLIGAAWLSSAACNRLRDWVDALTSPILKLEVQSLLFTYLLEHSPDFLQNNFAGKLGQKIRQAGEASVTLLAILSNDVLRLILAMVIGVSLSAGESWMFPLLLIGWTLPTVVVSVFLARRCLALSRVLSDEISTCTGVIVDVVTNADIVRAFAQGPFECIRVAQALGKEMNAAKKLRWFILIFAAVLYTGLLLFQFAFTALAVHKTVSGSMGVGELVMVISLGAIIGNNVWGLCTRAIDFFDQFGVLHSALDVILIPHANPDLPEAPTLQVTAGAIRFQNIAFAHRDGSRVFQNFNLSIRPGEKVGLVGPSGAGKSTLIRMLRRHFEPQSGQILIDGQDIATVSLSSLNQAVAEVPQDPGLFHRSIADNIGYARSQASEDEVVEAAGLAHCHGFIMARPQGYQSIVGERGVRLSGGERQRIAIARAFLKKARLLVLDEATSALDSETEHAIREALWQLFEGRTVIAIAHRLSTVNRMDRILYLENGSIEEEGSHAQLLARGGRYARLWTRQLDGFITEEVKGL